MLALLSNSPFLCFRTEKGYSLTHRHTGILTLLHQRNYARALACAYISIDACAYKHTCIFQTLLERRTRNCLRLHHAELLASAGRAAVRSLLKCQAEQQRDGELCWPPTLVAPDGMMHVKFKTLLLAQNERIRLQPIEQSLLMCAPWGPKVSFSGL